MRPPRWRKTGYVYEATMGRYGLTVYGASFGVSAAVHIVGLSAPGAAEVRLPRAAMHTRRDGQRIATAWVEAFDREWPRGAEDALADYYPSWRRSIRTRADAIERLMLNDANDWIDGAVLDTSRWQWDEMRDTATAENSTGGFYVGALHRIRLGGLHLSLRQTMQEMAAGGACGTRILPIAEHWRLEREGEPGPDSDDGAPRLWPGLFPDAPAFNVPDDARPDWVALALEACTMVRDRSLVPEHAAMGAAGAERIRARWPQ